MIITAAYVHACIMKDKEPDLWVCVVAFICDLAIAEAVGRGL
jgi:hypothetical protein